MGDYKRDSEQDNSMDCPIWGTDDISDEELLKEFEAVKNMTVPLPIPSPSSDEFEKIWARIQEEKAESKNVPESDQPEHPKVIKPRFGWILTMEEQISNLSMTINIFIFVSQKQVGRHLVSMAQIIRQSLLYIING